METYRYQLTSRADFERFIGFLIENRISFTTSHGYSPYSGDHVYHIAVTSEDDKAEATFLAVGSFLDSSTDLRKADHMNSLYNDASEAYNDPNCDQTTLHNMLGDCLNLIKELNEGNKAIQEDLKKQLEEAKDDAEYYKRTYKTTVKFDLRIKKQILALTALLDTIYVDD